MKTVAVAALGAVMLALCLGPLSRAGQPEERRRTGIQVDDQGRTILDADGARRTYGPPEPAAAPAPLSSTALIPAFAPTGFGPVVVAEETPFELDFDQVFESTIYGYGIGGAGFVPADLDGDGKLELLVGTYSGWYVLEHDPASGRYEITWSAPSSQYGSIYVTAIAARRTAGDWRILVGLGDGRVQVWSAARREMETEFSTGTDVVSKILFADVDNDGAEELGVVTTTALRLYEPDSLLFERSIDLPGTATYSGTDVVIGNVDRDARNEIVLGNGRVLDVQGDHVDVQWTYNVSDYGGGFGALVELADVDGDGVAEIVASAGWYKITVYDADLQSPKYERQADLDIAALLLADVTGDGVVEILYGDGQWGEIHVLRASDGQELFAIPNPEHGVTRIAVANLDADPALELVWGAGHTSSGPDYLYVHDLATRAREFQSEDIVGPFNAVTAGDVDGDGRVEIVSISHASDSGYGGGVMEIRDAETYVHEYRSTRDRPEGFGWYGTHDVAVGDVDADGAAEIVVATDRLFVFDGRTRVREAMDYFNAGAMASLLLDDVDADGAVEIVAGSQGGKVLILNGATRAIEWESTTLGTGYVQVYAVETGNVDADAAREIVVTTGDRLFVIDALSHVTRQSSDTGGFWGVATTDLDGDGREEIIVGQDGGMLARIDPVTLAAEPLDSVCSEPVRSVKAGDSVALAGSVQFTCGAQAGIYGIFEERVLWRSAPFGSEYSDVGFGNNLTVRDRGTKAQLVVGAQTGIHVFEGYGLANTDIDGDGIRNHADNCPEVANPEQADADGDRVGDLCNDSSDADADEWADALDNCAATANANQRDADHDGVGDACNDASDADGDEWADALDNCPNAADGGQGDRDGDGIGNVCDAYAGDNERARCQEAEQRNLLFAQLLGDLMSQPRYFDVDGDREVDQTDACPNTPANTSVDTAGCSQAQFCARIQDNAPDFLPRCTTSDWQNDESGATFPKDCTTRTIPALPGGTAVRICVAR